MNADAVAQVNIGIFVRCETHWPWLRTFLSRARMRALMGDDWREGEYFIERVEFEAIQAVHFVIYGVLGRGVSSCRLLDSLGKGFADFVRDVVVEVPRVVVEEVEGLRRRRGLGIENGVGSG